jgi:pimeloyl-ACP methyl ester carboxylesterase
MVPGRLPVVLQMFAPRRQRRPAGGPAHVVTVDDGRPASRRGYLYQLAAALGWTTLPLLPFLRQPTLLLAGADDPVVPVINARIMARLLPDARLHVHPHGHLALIDRAADLAPLIEKFLDEARPRRPRVEN